MQMVKPANKDKNEIFHAYRTLWTSFITATKDLPYQVEPKSFMPVVEIDRKVDKIEIATKEGQPLRLLNWPRRVSSDERLDIFIEIKQRVSVYQTKRNQKRYVVEASWVRTTYAEHKDISRYSKDLIECYPIEVIRYDMELNKPGHPLFHAQVAHDPIQTVNNNRLFKSLPPRLKELHIPTPPMDLRAVLYGLVADHVNFKLKDLRNNRFWQGTEIALPIMPCDSIREKISAAKRMMNTCWYLEV